jgi:hypothetical protein
MERRLGAPTGSADFQVGSAVMRRSRLASLKIEWRRRRIAGRADLKVGAPSGALPVPRYQRRRASPAGAV